MPNKYPTVKKTNYRKSVFGRPDSDANLATVEKLLPDGTWVSDDGKPGLAFSGLDNRGFPKAWGPPGESASATEVMNEATNRTCKKYGCANGRYFGDEEKQIKERQAYIEKHDLMLKQNKKGKELVNAVNSTLSKSPIKLPKARLIEADGNFDKETLVVLSPESLSYLISK